MISTKARIDANFFSSIAREGADKAAVSLSRLLGVKVEIILTESRILSIDQACAQLGSEGEGLGICLQVTGDLGGTVLITFNNQDVPGLCSRIRGIPAGAGIDHGLVQSALLETGNILTGSFLSAVAEATGLDYQSSPPAMARDMLDAIMVSVIAGSTDRYDRVVYMDNHLIIDDMQISGELVYFPAANTVARLNSVAKKGE